jgi:hypothetical protein
MLAAADEVIGPQSGYLYLAAHITSYPLKVILISSVLAGWLMALGAWVILGTHSNGSQILSIYIVTFIIGVGGLHHSIAGSVELMAAYFSNPGVDFWSLPPTIGVMLLGNMIGGKRIDRPGSFMETTILTNIAPDNPAFRTEFFGPVALLFHVKDEAAAIALANDSDFGLGGSVFTKDPARGKRVASQIDTGMMFINNIDWTDAALPFGGVKDSGYGRELGEMGIQQFVNKKLVRTISMEAPL